MTSLGWSDYWEPEEILMAGGTWSTHSLIRNVLGMLEEQHVMARCLELGEIREGV